ncbi:hypothetical protein DVW02_13915 [Clostridium botulinum]|nr:hypothetical protein [Clostridium botulinum]
MSYIINGLDMFLTGILMYVLYPFLPNNIWIISEREDQAQDNGIAFLKYLNKNHPEIKSVYLLEKHCDKIDSANKIGQVIIKGSLKHKLYFLKSTVVASTEKNIIEPWGSRIFYRTFSKIFPKKLKVFLQHGILDKDVSEVYGKLVSDIDLFVTTTNKEKLFVIDKFGYRESEVANVGISRYDELIELKDVVNKDNIILYMPTWRRYLFDLANCDEVYVEKAKEAFLKSYYYKNIQSLLIDKNLNDILQKENYKLIFITHHGINKLGEAFTVDSKNIKIYKSEQINIAELLVKSKIFITDYSSIHFDSAYIGNKNIYYQFDENEFFKEHAGKSYFEYERDGFGKVIKQKDELITEIYRIIKKKDTQNEEYSKRADSFFEFKDKNNCERLYNLIKEKLS